MTRTYGWRSGRLGRGLAGAGLAAALTLGPLAGGATAAPAPTPQGEVVSAADRAELEAYITSVYLDLLDRAPEPAGLDDWVTRLATGTPYQAVALGITNSTEFRIGLITSLYEYYLGRTPDAAGLQHHLDNLGARGWTTIHLEAQFLSSEEYLQAAFSGGSADWPVSWLTAVYQDVLGRDPSVADVEYWGGMVPVRGFVPVAERILLSEEALAPQLDGWYQHLLGRGLDPTGRRHWVAAMQRGERLENIIAGIVASTEYRRLAVAG